MGKDDAYKMQLAGIRIFLLLSFRGSLGWAYLSFRSGNLPESLSRMACGGGGSAMGHFPRVSHHAGMRMSVTRRPWKHRKWEPAEIQRGKVMAGREVRWRSVDGRTEEEK